MRQSNQTVFPSQGVIDGITAAAQMFTVKGDTATARIAAARAAKMQDSRDFLMGSSDTPVGKANAKRVCAA